MRTPGTTCTRSTIHIMNIRNILMGNVSSGDVLSIILDLYWVLAIAAAVIALLPIDGIDWFRYEDDMTCMKIFLKIYGVCLGMI